MASAPIARLSCASLFGAQCTPPSLLFQTPPPAAPAYTTALLLGSTASAAIRPDAAGPPEAAAIACGPGLVQLHPSGAAELGLAGPAPVTRAAAPPADSSCA